MKLIATKSLMYGTRRMQANDEFEATSGHGRVLIAARKAKLAPSAPARIEPPQPQLSAEEIVLENLHTEAVGLGIKADRRWGAARLQSEIATKRNAEGAQNTPNGFSEI